ncbi:hypothetical protein Q763_12995 [Flavobacterium beibuense F44-8]|uniref:Uncharacterized protein n=2 Tax=Flavobacterium beibuense TaxID=657326 RepID=A0A0A2LKG5_9FLAO|nr:hypothetical protein Q763_12995 [Flavobacterium beibuense F44-8]
MFTMNVVSKTEKLRKAIYTAIETKSLSDVYTDFDVFTAKIVELITTNEVTSAFDFFNELVNLKEESIDDLLDGTLYENLYKELGDNETLFINRLNERSVKLYRLAVYIRKNPSTRKEIIQHQKSLGL